MISTHFKKITLPIHILTIAAPFFIEINWWVVLLGWIFISGFGIAIGYHRYFSHKAFKTYPFFHVLLIFLGCLSGQGSPIFWAALHRGSHHRLTDTLGDIHSPVNGKLQSYINWQIFFDPKFLNTASVKDLARDKWIVWSHKNYYRLFWLTILVTFLINATLGLSLLLIPIIISMHQENLINLVCHLQNTGYRNHETRDNSTNLWLLGLLTWGHGYHNNHHAFPNRYNYGNKWYEIDLSVPLINLIKKSN